MWANPGCDMASVHASYRAKANLEAMELARSVTVNLCVISAPANYVFRCLLSCIVYRCCAQMRVHEFIQGNNSKVKLWVYIQTHLQC